MNKDQLTELCKAIAINVAKNAGVVPEVCFPHIYLGLQDHFKAQAAIAPPVAAGSVDTPALQSLFRAEQQRAERAEADLAATKKLMSRFWTGQYFDGVTKGDAAEINEALK